MKTITARRSAAALARELEATRERLAEAEQTLEAIRRGEVDGLMGAGPAGEQVFTLHGAQEPYRLLIEQMSEAALTLSPTGVIFYANHTLARLLRQPLERVIGAELAAFVVPDDRPRLAALIALGWQRTSHGDLSIRAVDGTIVPLHLGLSRLELDTQTLLSIVATDLTAVRKKERELQELQAVLEQRVAERTAELRLFRVLVERSSDGIHVLDAQSGRFLDVNETASQALGYTRAELLGRTVADVAADLDAALFDALVRRLHAESRVVHEHRQRRRDGTEFPVEVSLSLAELDRRYVVAIVRDISERKAAERELELAHREMVRLSRLSGMAEVATNILHDVGNVLTSVSVSAEVVADRLQRSSADRLARLGALLGEHAHDLPRFLAEDPQGRALPDYLQRLAAQLAAPPAAIVRELEAQRKNIDHIREIVAMQQKFARVGRVLESVQARELMEDALCLSSSGIGRLEIGVVRDLADLPLLADRHKVLQVLVNLLKNAIQALASAPAPRRLTLRAAASEPGGIVFEIADNGVGIEPALLVRIFSHGFTTRKDGHGFGLHSAALTARELGGRLTAHSDGPGRGAMFRLELPLNQESNPP